MNRTIAELRNAIDAVDQQLLLLLNQRASLADEIGDIKRQEGSQVDIEAGFCFALIAPRLHATGP